MLNLTRTSAMACAQLRRNAPTYSRILSIKTSSTESCQPRVLGQNRQFTQSTVVAYARKDSQDRNSINRESLEYSRSGSDDKTAALDDAAFNPDITDPDSQKKKAGKDSVSKFSHKQRGLLLPKTWMASSAASDIAMPGFSTCLDSC